MRQYVVDAFTDEPFGGNPAAVCVMEAWPSDELMRDIAIENNLSETAFAVKERGEGEDLYHLRWFTPAGEIDFCGHATLATSYVVHRFVAPGLSPIRFSTLGGILTVRVEGDLILMDMPTFKLSPIDVTQQMADALGACPVEAYMGADMVCVLESAEQVRAVVPDQEIILSMEGSLLHVTARGDGEFDCETRSFAPKHGIPEDPVCGRGHCHVASLWAGKLGRSEILAHQASRRGGVLHCRYEGDRTILGGRAALFSIDEVLPDGIPGVEA